MLPGRSPSLAKRSESVCDLSPIVKRGLNPTASTSAAMYPINEAPVSWNGSSMLTFSYVDNSGSLSVEKSLSEETPSGRDS